MTLGYETDDGSGTGYSALEMTVEEDTGGGYAVIPYGKTGDGHTKFADRYSCSQSWLRSFDSGDKIRVRVVRVTATSLMDTRVDTSQITIERVN